MIDRKNEHEEEHLKPLSVWKCLECDNRSCPGYKEVRRLRRDAALRVGLLIEYYGWERGRSSPLFLA